METTNYFKNTLREETTVNNYLIKKILGIGGFGVTYLAEDMNLKRDVAIKEYFPQEIAIREKNLSVAPKSDKHEDPFIAGVEKFSNEAAMLAKFNHPNIVRVLGFFSANGTAYFVMDYEVGLSLEAFLSQRKKPIEEEELLDIFHPILDGLNVVHYYQMLHRDIKPANIYLRASGSPLLIDFGAARYAIGQASRSLSMVLTEGYAPFEQYRSDAQSQGPWTDLYALGATMYRCIALKAPPRAPDRYGPDGDIDPYKPAISIGAGRYSQELLEAIDCCLAVKTKNRPQTVDELQKMLPSGNLGPMSQEKLERVKKYRIAFEFAWEPDHNISKQERESLTFFKQRLGLSDYEAIKIEKEVTGEAILPPIDLPPNNLTERINNILNWIASLEIRSAAKNFGNVQVRAWFQKLQLNERLGRIKSSKVFKKLKDAQLLKNLKLPAFLKNIQTAKYIQPLVEKYKVLEIGKKVRSLKIVQYISEIQIFAGLSRTFEAIPNKKYFAVGLAGMLLIPIILILSKSPEAPTAFKGLIAPNRTVRLTWKLPDSPQQFLIERSENSAIFQEIAKIEGDVRQFVDQNVRPGVRYTYRMLAEGFWQDSEFIYSPELLLNIIIVSKRPGEAVQTIEQAVKIAKPGMIISVEPGIYQEAIVIDKTLQIVADNEADSVILQSAGTTCLTMNTEDATVKNLFIRQLESEAKAPAILINQGALLLENCDVSSRSGAGISVQGAGTNALMANCRIHSGEQEGIVFEKDTRGQIKNSEIFENKGVGISLSDSAALQIDSCKIFSGGSVGILFEKNSFGTVENSQIFQNKSVGIQILSGATPLIDSCRIFNGSGQGILVKNGGSGQVVNCIISRNRGAGIEVQSGYFKADSCEISRGSSAGLLLSYSANGSFTRCQIIGNAGNGVEISTSRNPSINYCSLSYSGRSGVLFGEGAKGSLTGCNIIGNKADQVSAVKSTLSLSRCRIYDGKANGVSFSNSKGSLNDCEIFRNAQNGLVIASKSVCKVSGGQISQSGENGVVIDEADDAQISSCQIFKNKFNGIHIPKYGKMYLRNSRIYQNSNFGIEAGDRSSGYINSCTITGNRVPTRILSKYLVQKNNTVR